MSLKCPIAPPASVYETVNQECEEQTSSKEFREGSFTNSPAVDRSKILYVAVGAWITAASKRIDSNFLNCILIATCPYVH